MDLYSVAEQTGAERVYLTAFIYFLFYFTFREEKLNETDGIVVQRGNF